LSKTKGEESDEYGIEDQKMVYHFSLACFDIAFVEF